MSDYLLGNLIRCSADFINKATGAYVDPTTVVFKYKQSTGIVYTYTYGVDGELVKDSTGKYHVDLDASIKGRWYYRFESTGVGQAASDADFTVLPSPIS